MLHVVKLIFIAFLQCCVCLVCACVCVNETVQLLYISINFNVEKLLVMSCD